MATTKTDADAPTTKTYIVANGRTVHGDDEPVGPGGEIVLDEKEGKRLQKLGFLRSDEGDIVVDETAGPVVVTGAEIKEV